MKTGYKQTEIGVIPEDWEVKTIKEISNPVRGGSPRPAGSPKYFNGDYIPWLTVAALTNIPEFQIFVSETEGYLTKEGSLHSRTLEKETLIIANSGATLGVAKLLAIKCCANDGIAALFDVDKNAEKRFVVYYINSLTKKLRTVVATGNGQPNLNTDLIGNIVIPFPPLPEQTAIAAALSDVDALMGELDKLIAKKRDIKQATMQQLLTGKKRLAGFSGEWEVKRLGDLFEITSSKRVFQSEWKSEGVPFYRARELAVLSEKGTVQNELFISHEMYDEFEKMYGIPQINDILVTGVGTLGKVYVVPDNQKFYFKDGNIIWFKISKTVRADFLKQLYLTPFITKQIDDSSSGTTVGTYTISGAKNTIIPFPTLEEQTAIATILSDMDAEINALQQKREKTAQLKQGMMQELLTGRIRLIGGNA
jgi:type I restriction enzyme S subunit